MDELCVTTSILLKTKEANVTSYAYKPDKILKILCNGSYTIPKSEFTDSKSTISIVEFNFRTIKTGKTNPKLIKDSKISITKSIEKTANFDELTK